MQTQSTTQNLILSENILQFITGGKAIFTLLSTKTNKHFTYKVTCPKDKSRERSDILFVSVLSGSDNTSDYTYIGYLKKTNGAWTFFYDTNSKFKHSSLSIVAFNYCFNGYYRSNSSDLNGKVEFLHMGKCCRCARPLTDQQSIKNGIGPDCLSMKLKIGYFDAISRATNY